MLRLLKFLSVFLLICTVGMLGFTAYGQETGADAPVAGEVVLTVSGAITAPDGSGLIEFDLEKLRALGLSSIETTTVWTDGVQQFEGVRLVDFVDAIGAADKSALMASALNEYQVEIPLSDATEDGPILALRMGGVDLSPRDKGPIWIVYPYDASPDYRTDVIYARSIWQVDAIEVLP